jgi:transposase
VATREGLPVAFEIFDGNRTDVTTTQEMVEAMETKYGKANRVWVMDRGMVSEDNLEFMRQTNTRYLVGTPKSLLKKFEQALVDQHWEEVQPGIEVKLCRSPEGNDEIFVLCRSIGRKQKENAILNRFVARLGDAPWRTLQQWMKTSGLGTSPRKLLTEIREIKSLDVLLPAKDKIIRIRVAATAPRHSKCSFRG